MLTILIPNYYKYDDLNNIILEFIKVKNAYVKMIIIDADSEINARKKILTHGADNIDVYFGSSSGVYAAFNFGIKLLKSKYYMVLGVDDVFKFNKLIYIINILKETDYDLLFLGIEKSGILSQSLKIDSILSGPQGVFPSHTGGVIINRYLHEKYGLYSSDYKVLSDGYFISKCLLDKKIKFGLLGENFCMVGDVGFSKKKEFLSEYEGLQIRIKFGQSLVKSYYIFFIRSLKRLVKNLLHLLKLR